MAEKKNEQQWSDTPEGPAGSGAENAPEHAVPETVDESRRDFVRKASYSTPAIMALGLAGHARRAGAQFEGPPSAPPFNGIGTTEEEDEEFLLDAAGKEKKGG